MTGHDTASLRRQSAEARENLRHIEERVAVFALSTDVILQRVKEQHLLPARIAELEAQLPLPAPVVASDWNTAAVRDLPMAAPSA